MSLLLMSTDPPPSRGLSSFSLRLKVPKALSRRSSVSGPSDEQCSTDSPGLLSPLEPSRSRSSSTSRSIIQSFTSSQGKWIHAITSLGNRSRSPSVDPAVEDTNKPLKKRDFKQVQGWFDAFEKYNRLITNQVTVDPSFPAEELSKIQTTLSELNDGGFVSDLPEALFDIALLWCPAGNITRKPADAGEPSWSWRGWNGSINFPFDPSSCPDVRRRGQPVVFFESKIKSFNLGSKSQAYTIRNRDLSLKRGAGQKQQSRIKYPTEGIATLLGSKLPTSDCNTLRFTTEKLPAAAFIMEQIYYGARHPVLCSGLMDSQNRPCGVVMDYENNIRAHYQEGELYFILLSVNRRVESTFRKSQSNITHPSGIPIWHDKKFLNDEEINDPEAYEKGEWKMYNVMLIQEFEEQKSDDGSVVQEAFARRVAIGRIHEDAWNAASPNKAVKIVLR